MKLPNSERCPLWLPPGRDCGLVTVWHFPCKNKRVTASEGLERRTHADTPQDKRPRTHNRWTSGYSTYQQVSGAPPPTYATSDKPPSKTTNGQRSRFRLKKVRRPASARDGARARFRVGRPRILPAHYKGLNVYPTGHFELSVLWEQLIMGYLPLGLWEQPNSWALPSTCVHGAWDFALADARRLKRHTKNHPATDSSSVVAGSSADCDCTACREKERKGKHLMYYAH